MCLSSSKLLNLLYSFWCFVHFSPVFDALLPGPDVPDPGGADGDDHQDRKQEDAHQDGHDNMDGVSWNINSYLVCWNATDWLTFGSREVRAPAEQLIGPSEVREPAEQLR